MRIVALAGGVGGAKLAHGLAQILSPQELTVIVNTGDDFEHYGLYICPDLDTVCYTLAGLANPETGWGRVNETWNAIKSAAALGGIDWFNLGDKDLGTHLERTRRLKAGDSLSQITSDFCKAWGVQHAVLPMSDQPVRTIVATNEGEFAFQEYFVHRRCAPKVTGFRFEGADESKPAAGAQEALQSASAIVICPSNPWVSVDPIRSVISIPAGKPVVAVSPIIGGEAIKGPAAKMYRELGVEPSALAVANHYRSAITHFVIDRLDAPLFESINALNIQTLATNTFMANHMDRKQLASEVLHFIGASV